MLIRRETPQDVDAISAVTTAAFRRWPDAPEPPETALVSRLRADAGWLPALSLVAMTNDAVIGHVVCTRGFVDDTPALGLGPISVLPDRQRGGVGHALMHSVLGAADASGEPLVALLGDPVLSTLRLRRRVEARDRRARHSLGQPLPGACAEFGPTPPHRHLSLRLALRRTLSVRQPTAGPEADRLLRPL